MWAYFNDVNGCWNTHQSFETIYQRIWFLKELFWEGCDDDFSLPPHPLSLDVNRVVGIRILRPSVNGMSHKCYRSVQLRGLSFLLSGSKSSEHGEESGSQGSDPAVSSQVSDSPGVLTANATSLRYAQWRTDRNHGNGAWEPSGAKCD